MLFSARRSRTSLAGAAQPSALDQLDLHLPLCTVSIPLAASAQFAVPALLPVAALLYAYTSVPTFKEAHRVLVEEKRIGVDALDAVVMVGCLGTMSIFPGAVCCWCLSFGRFLVRQSRDRSQKLLLDAFGKQPRYAWLCRDGAAVQVPTDRLEKGDIIVIHTGEVVPADGRKAVWPYSLAAFTGAPRPISSSTSSTRPCSAAWNHPSAMAPTSGEMREWARRIHNSNLLRQT